METKTGCSKVFITYDINLKRYLWNNGIDNIICGLNPKNNNKFWVYERNNILNDMLDKWFIAKQ